MRCKKDPYFELKDLDYVCRMRGFLIFIFLIVSIAGETQQTDPVIMQDTLFVSVQGDSVFIAGSVQVPVQEIQAKEHVRLTAAILCLTLGPFGAHRLYLGTSTPVPVFYTLTLGGGLGVLPVIDFVLIVFSKDLERYKNNPNVFMWSEKEGG